MVKDVRRDDEGCVQPIAVLPQQPVEVGLIRRRVKSGGSEKFGSLGVLLL
jgi:hypothetical protein